MASTERASRLRKYRGYCLTPVLILVIYLLAFGLQAAQQGYYLDDWIILNSYSRGGPLGLFYYAFWGNRPLVSWLWLVGLNLLQFNPLAWQIWAMLWRWLAVVILWMALRRLWPRAGVQVSLAALLFAVYPLFRQQSSALTYSFHWICFFLWGLSIFSMILAVQRPKQFLLWMSLSVVTGAAQLFSQEFFVGLELLRPAVLWLALGTRGIAGCGRTRCGRTRRTLLAWAPFLVLFAGYLAWRTRFMPTPGVDRNTPGMLYGLLSAPLTTLPRLAVMVVQDLIQILLGTWYETVQPSQVAITPISSLAAWGVAGLAFLASLGFFRWILPRFDPEEGGDEPAATEAPWYRAAIPFGFLAVLLGFTPGWTIGAHITDSTGIYNDRFGLAAMFGAAILLVGLIEAVIKTRTYRLVLACMLIGLGAGQNFRYATVYRWSWEKQAQLYWQLKWRAPELRRPTTLYGEGSIVSYLGSWATTSAISQMYGPASDPWFYDFWYRDVTKIDVDAELQNALKSKKPLRLQMDSMQYEAPAGSGLVIDFEPEKLQCLWVLGPQDKTNPYLSDALAQAVPLSNLSQVIPESSRPLDKVIFGREPAHDWCYYYEKADLARQQQDWAKVVSLWRAAEAQGKHPHVGVEYGPFIEAFAHSGDWTAALDLTRKADFPKYVMGPYVCNTWARIDGATPASAEKRQAIQTAIDDFECQDVLKNK